MNFLRKLSSLKITLVGMGLMVMAAMLVYGDPTAVSIWVLVTPMAILAVNLSAAIISNQKINQQPGLLLFHVCLLSLILLAGVGRLIHLDAHMELRANQAFAPEALLEVRAGPLHQGDIEQVHFVQGPYRVNYAEGLKRGLTHSYVRVQNPHNPALWEPRDVGDDRPLLIGNYRFYTTFNKGFSAILTWIPESGEAVTGAINMPSYPLFDYKQDNQWTPPGSDQAIRFWLRLTTGMDEKADWVLDPAKASAILVVHDGERRIELKTGESIALAHGQLRYEALSAWMGYRVFYDPTIQWLFIVSIIGVAGLAYYFWDKLNLQVWTEDNSVTEQDSASPAKQTTAEIAGHSQYSSTELKRKVKV